MKTIPDRFAGAALAVWRDVRYAARSLRRSPWYASTVIGVIALSMALATTVFAVVDGVLFKPLPYPRVQELVAVDPGWTSRPSFIGNISSSPADASAWKAAAPEVQFTTFSLGGREQIDEGEPARSAEVAENFFDVLGQRPLIGGFRPEHFKALGAAHPAVLTYACWQRRFGGDPGVVGRIVRGDRGNAVEMVGILQEDFLYPSSLGRFVPEVITPLIPRANDATDLGRGGKVLARVPPAVPIAALQDRLTAATLDLAKRFPAKPGARGPGPFNTVRVLPMDQAIRLSARQTFSIVFVTAAALVLLACLNVTGLAAARVQDRGRELALRRALGGSGADLVRLFAAESLLIVSAGSAIGLLASLLLLRVTAGFLPDSLVLLKPLALDLRLCAFAVLASAVCVAVTTLWRGDARDDPRLEEFRLASATHDSRRLSHKTTPPGDLLRLPLSYARQSSRESDLSHARTRR